LEFGCHPVQRKPDGSFTSAARSDNVDTGKWVSSARQRSFRARRISAISPRTVSNYETDIFRPLFDEIEYFSGKEIREHTPDNNSHQSTLNHQLSVDIAFRVVADHIRALSFAIADGIIPSNEGAAMFAQDFASRGSLWSFLGFHEPFFFKLVDVVAKTMGDVFPEVRAKTEAIKEHSARRRVF
jgi:alanyl-tRNA synthetase